MGDTYFDRRVHDELLAALMPGGFADSLVELGRSGQYCLDLQLRGNPKTNESWATLYAGTTKVLDLKRHKSGKFSLAAHPTHASPEQHGWDDTWRKPREAKTWSGDWAAVEHYLERVIPSVGTSFSKEGRIQASLSLYPARDMVVIDRETVVGYTNATTRTRILAQHLTPLMDALQGAGTERWWTPKAPGNECDGLAISTTGELLAIEVKPANVTGLVWAPLQALHYADLLQHWADENDTAHEILLGMYQQRLDLGLIREPATKPALALPITTKAVVAIGGDLTPVWQERLILVAQRLHAAGRTVEFRRVNLVGRMDPLPLE